MDAGLRGNELGLRWFCQASRVRRAPLLILLLAGLATQDCGSSPASRTPTSGVSDKADNGQVAIARAGLTGAIDAAALKLSIPIHAVGALGASGSLHVRLVDVQETTTAAEATLAYALRPGESAVLQTSLNSPSTIATQADLGLWKVRIDDDKTNSLRVTRSLLLVIPPNEVRLEGSAKIAKDKSISYRVRAEDALTKSPIAAAKVSLNVLAKDGSQVSTLAGETSALGEALFSLSLPQPGDFVVQARTDQNGITPTVQDSLTVVAPGPKILLTSDKPIYQPGQTVHLRTLTLTSPDSKPVAASPVLVEIEDGKGNKVFKKSVTADSFGIAATTFTLGSLVNTGTFTLRASSGDVKTEKTVSVSTYALPKFDVAIKTDKPWYRAGDTVVGTVDARYFFGKNVAGGDVVVQASSLDVGQTPFQRIMGTLDTAGHFQFMVLLPKNLAGTKIEQGNASISVQVTVSDTAGQTVEKDALLTVSPDGLSIVLVPESTKLVPGLANELDLFVTDPLGAPVAGAAAVIVAPDAQSLTATTDAYGQAVVSWQPTPNTPLTGNFNVQLTPPAGGAPLSKAFSFGFQQGDEHLLVRTDASLYKLGDTVTVDVLTSDKTHYVYVDWINSGQTVSMRTLEAAAGHAGFTMSVDAALAGSNRVQAYVVDASGNVVRAGRTLYVQTDNSLAVSMTADKPIYAPGDPAKLTFSVQDTQGRPTVAALGVQIVDQAVFSLVDAHPGLLRSFFELESMYATPSYEIAAPSVDYNQLLFVTEAKPDAERAHQTLTKAAFAALGEATVAGISRGSWADVLVNEKTLLQPAYTATGAELNTALHAAAQGVLTELANQGCRSDQYYCNALNGGLGDLVSERLVQRFRGWDYWGNPFAVTATGGFAIQLTGNGPDEIAGDADDESFQVDLSDLFSVGQGKGFPGGGVANAGMAGGAPMGAAPGVALGGAASGSTAAAPVTAPGPGAADTSASPRVRKDFPETLYVNPSVITGPDGIASVDVPLADSITEWRVSTMANSADGRLGGSESGFKVFQEFFVDINFPATLTRGDQVSFPVAIYNYRTDAQTVQLTLSPDNWYTPMGTTAASVTLQPGEVTGVSFPVRVDQVGLHSLTVKALGTSKSDAVSRSVQVLPDGKLFTDTSSGALATGATTTHSFAFPASAVPGSGQLYVEVYPAFLSQVVSGMESILREPSGCFEQTTSTTWPNVLVLSYLEQTHMLKPDVQIKAESLISTGYQRLLTFEHPGGGFSWFGVQDGNPFLSVTAFGLMEFADMAKVATVDDAMIARTRTWLLGQQQADGSWIGDRTEFFSFNTSTVRNTAFVLAALGNSGYSGAEVAKGVAYLRAHAGDAANDAYTLAMMGNALELTAPTDAAVDVVFSKLDTMKQVTGDQIHWDTGGTQTCFYQGGMDSDVTATALATHALLLRGGAVATVEGAIKFLAGHKDPNGNFGSTQATVWTLRALLLAASKGTSGAVGALTISVDGVPARTVALTADQSDVMTTVDLSGQAPAGSHDVGLSFAGTGTVTFNSVGKYNVPWSLIPPPPAGQLTITVSYDKTSLYVDETVQETVTVHNNTAGTENMVLATLGIPPGFAVTAGDLDAMLQAHTLSKYEVTGKQVVLYISQIAAGADVKLNYGLHATMPVRASDGAAEAHPYYQPSDKAHAPEQTITVLAK